jgi:hypothetical protein
MGNHLIFPCILFSSWVYGDAPAAASVAVRSWWVSVKTLCESCTEVYLQDKWILTMQSFCMEVDLAVVYAIWLTYMQVNLAVANTGEHSRRYIAKVLKVTSIPCFSLGTCLLCLVCLLLAWMLDLNAVFLLDSIIRAYNITQKGMNLLTASSTRD